MVTYFDGNRLQFHATDPPSDESYEGIQLPLTRPKLLEAYYRPFRTWLSTDPQASTIEHDDVRYRIAPVENVDVRVGLETSTPSQRI
jgi:hypothetical protein